MKSTVKQIVMVLLMLGFVGSVSANTVGNGNLWVSVDNHGTTELREYSVNASSATLLHTYSAPTVFTDMQYTESLGSPQLVAVDGATNNIYFINTSTGAITTQAIQVISDTLPTAVAVTYNGHIAVLTNHWGTYNTQYRIDKLTWNGSAGQWDRAGFSIPWQTSTYGTLDNSFLSDLDPMPVSDSDFYFGQSRAYPGEAQNSYGKLSLDWNSLSGTEDSFYTAYAGNGGEAFRDIDVAPDGTMVSGLAQNLKKAGIFDENGNLLKTYYYDYPSGYRIEGGVHTIASNADGSLILLSPESQYSEGWETASIDEIIVIDSAAMGNNSGALYKIDLESGVHGEIQPSAIAMAWETVPEPMTAILMLFGLMGMRIRRIR